jgi:muramoyltetrapeptide carboxypeptidase LdcA involved in peptidoglycan recycling
MNFLWLQGIPSYYGGALFTQFAMQGGMEPFTTEYLRHALFDTGEFELRASAAYNDIGLDWNDASTLHTKRQYEPNDGWHWDGDLDAAGITWGGCLESIDELLRHGIDIPSLDDFSQIVLMSETSEEIPSADYVHRVYRALGERGMLERVRAVLVGRPKAWEFGHEMDAAQKEAYRLEQRRVTLATIREYNVSAPVVQNMDFGHTNPQIPMPYGGTVRLLSSEKRIFAEF